MIWQISNIRIKSSGRKMARFTTNSSSTNCLQESWKKDLIDAKDNEFTAQLLFENGERRRRRIFKFTSKRLAKLCSSKWLKSQWQRIVLYLTARKIRRYVISVCRLLRVLFNIASKLAKKLGNSQLDVVMTIKIRHQNEIK